jgi:hypothetical protein
MRAIVGIGPGNAFAFGQRLAPTVAPALPSLPRPVSVPGIARQSASVDSCMDMKGRPITCRIFHKHLLRTSLCKLLVASRQVSKPVAVTRCYTLERFMRRLGLQGVGRGPRVRVIQLLGNERSSGARWQGCHGSAERRSIPPGKSPALPV